MKRDEEDRKWMDLALEESSQDLRVHKVGAVIVKDGHLIAQAHGDKESGDHAEARALAASQATDLPGATVYTTLEPCLRVRGERNTDCAVRLAQNGISEVVVGMTDPDARVCGKGWQYLKDRNVRVRRFPKDLQIKIISKNFAFIEKMSVDGAAIRWSSRTEFTDLGKRRPPLGFAEELIPDIADVMALVDRYRRRPVAPRIVWSKVADALWRNLLIERLRVLEGLRIITKGDIDVETKEMNLEFLTEVIHFAWRIRAGAAARIPLMWRGMKHLWAGYRPDAFKEALVNYLTICSLHLLWKLHGAQRKRSPNLFPRGVRWLAMVNAKNNWLTDVYRDAFGHRDPFFILTVSKLGDWHPQPDFDLFAPRRAVLEIKEKAWTHKVEWVPLIYRQFVIPQVEYRLIGQSTVVKYGSMEWRRILDDKGEEVK